MFCKMGEGGQHNNTNVREYVLKYVLICTSNKDFFFSSALNNTTRVAPSCTPPDKDAGGMRQATGLHPNCGFCSK